MELQTPAAVPTPANDQPGSGVRKALVGLIGSGIQGSLSPAMHEEEARRQGLRLHYQLIDLGPQAPASTCWRC